MADKKDLLKQQRKISRPLNNLNKAFAGMMDLMTNSGSSRDRELDNLNDEIEKVVDDDLSYMKNYTGSSNLGTFLTQLFNDQNDQRFGQNPVKSLEDIFSGDEGSIFSMFQDRYKNVNLLYQDLDMICSELYELMEAVNTTRDAIVTADDVSQKVSRNIIIRGKEHDPDDKDGIRSMVENIEEKFGLLSKIKDHIIPKSLQYGTYYVYTAPYSKLFEQHYQNKLKDQEKNGTVLESMSIDEVDAFITSNNIVAEGTSPSVTSGKKLKQDTHNHFNSVLEHVTVYKDEDDFIPLIENAQFGSFMEEKFRKQVKEAEKRALAQGEISYTDGILDQDGKRGKSVTFDNIKDCYIKMIDPTRIIPIKILDEVIGYYYIHQNDIEVSKSPFTNTVSLNKKQSSQELETAFLTRITDRIVKAFDKPYLEENSEFKKLILNSLIYNDVYKKKIKFQFIPPEYITEFPINPDTDGNGRSVLLPSLFYSKLYLSLLIFKMMSIISNSNDQKIYYIKNSGLDTDVVNQVQNTARDIKMRQLNFNDLMNYNSMMGKVGAARSIFMPVGTSGERAIEFDILAGQQIELNSELMTMLRTGAINATGVPSVITEHINEVEYSRSLVMANQKFLANVVSRQLEFNPRITELYRKVLAFSTDLSEAEINKVTFTLAKPKAMVSTNLSDLIASTNQTIEFMARSAIGDNASPTDDENRIKDSVVKGLSQELMPMLPWDSLHRIMDSAKITLQKDKLENNGNGDDPQ